MVRWITGGVVRWIRIVPAIAAACALTAPPASAAAGWSLEHAVTPPGTPNGQLIAVSCVSSSDCIAVGQTSNGSGANIALAEHWNGRTWTRQSVPKPAGASSATLDGVSCPASGSCVAVGSFTDGSGNTDTLTERLTGTSWSIVPSPDAGGSINELGAVSCVSSADCWAVGDTNPGQSATPLAEHWDGTAWTIVATRAPAGASSAQLRGVSCSSHSACTAVGAADDKTLAERWNGSAWQIQPTPNPVSEPYGPNGTLTAVSCPAARDCMAVGYTHSGSRTLTLAEQWNGSSWTIEATVDEQQPITLLLGLSCTTSSSCTAVGTAGDDTPDGPRVTVAEHWDGSHWTLQSTPNPKAGGQASLGGVDCPTAGRCVAVGGDQVLNQNAPGSHESAFSELLQGGTWTLHPAVTPSGPTSSQFNGISCTSEDTCVAVGFVSPPNFRHTMPLAERRSGGRWRLIAPAPPPGSDSVFNAVSCFSSSACTAVGSQVDASGNTDVLVERFDGAHWTLESAPNPAGSSDSELLGVACASPTDCVAVGIARGSTNGTVTERWNGSSWAIDTTSTSNAPFAALLAVSCTTPSACTAVGDTENGSGNQNLAERFDGTGWAVQPTAFGGFLGGVSCPTLTRCEAVGTAPVRALVWDGASWHSQSLPVSGEARTGGVACSSAFVCTAVGTAFPSGGQQSLAWRKDSSPWTLQPTINPPGFTGFNAVSCPSDSTCYAAGSTGGNTVLVERYEAPA